MVERLIDAVYDAVGDDEGLERLVRAFTRELGAASAMFLELDADGGPRAVQWGHAPEMTVAYEAYFSRIDPWVAASPRAPPGSATSVERLVPFEQLRRTEFYNDFLEPHGMAHNLGVWMPFDGRITLLSIQRSRAQGPFETIDEERLQAVTPHLRRLAQTRWRSEALHGRATDLEALLDSRADAVLLVGADGRVLHGNAAAGTLMSSAGPLGCGPTGQLFARATADAVALADALGAQDGPPTSSRFGLGAGRYAAAVDPLPDRRAAVLTVRDLAARRERQARAATAAFALTPAEAALLATLLGGATPEDHARRRGLRMPTVRTQLRGLLAKAGVSRQSQLLERVSALPPD